MTATRLLLPTIYLVTLILTSTQGVSRVFNVKLTNLQVGSNWLSVDWEPDLAAAGAEGRLQVVLSLMWSTMPGLVNTLYITPETNDTRGFTPASHNFTELLSDTWYAVCLNATHIGDNFRKPTFSCSATKSLTPEGEEPSRDVINIDYELTVGATWADIHVREYNTPFTVVRWMVVARPSRSATGEGAYDPVHYQEHWHADEPTNKHHVFRLEGLRPDTTYFVTIEAGYKVNVIMNEKVHDYKDNFVITTLESGAQGGRASVLTVLATLAVALLLRNK